MGNAEKLFFQLLRFEICGGTLEESARALATKEALAIVFKLAKMHDIAHLIADALHKGGLTDVDEELYAQFKKQQQLAVYRYERMQYEYNQICEALERAQIAYLPLKGAVMREYYPEAWMRTSCDIDILVHPEHLGAAVSALKNGLQYKEDGGYTHDVSLYSENGVHLELHHTLIEERYYKGSAQVLSSVWSVATPVREGVYRHELPDEVFYFYHFAHMAKHFGHGGGCGVRSFIDVWILDNAFSYDAEKRNALLEKGRLAAFAAASEKLTKVWFADAEYDELSVQMQQYVLRGGTYGSFANRIPAQASKKGKKKYVLSRIFEPYETLKEKYPVLKKHKWLYPFYQVQRWFKLIFRKKNRDGAKREWEAIRSDDKNAVFDLMKALEL